MITRRDCLVALAAACLTLGAVGMTQSPRPVMGTSFFGWNELEEEQTGFGTVRDYVRAPTSTLLDLGIRAVTIEPGESPHPPRPHARSQEELIIVKEGTLEVELRDVIRGTVDRVDEPRKELGPGSMLFLAPNQWHALRNSSEQTVTIYTIDWVSPGMIGENN